MEITGYDNVLTSSKAFNSIINQFEDELKSMWPEMLVDSETIMDQENWFERFYAKNNEMLYEHENHGFNSNINGQGCLYLICSKKSSLWQYTLVTPESIQKSGFSKKVFTILKDCLTD